MKIALIGRSNVGKSSLFNRLVGRRLAIVDDSLGVTRDRREFPVVDCGHCSILVDTPGVVPLKKDELAMKMNRQSEAAVKDAECVFFVIDGIDGVTYGDQSVARWLRQVYKQHGNRKTFVVTNKSENLSSAIAVQTLGFGDAIYVSAEHNINICELRDKIFELCREDADHADDKDSVLKIAIVGRPNVGKSTLINSALGYDRLISCDMAGTTRDSILVPFEFNGRKIELIDTAGQRKRTKIDNDLENTSVLDAWRYIKQSNVVIIVCDVNAPLEKHELNVARKVADEGKIVIFAINKVDTVVDLKERLNELRQRLEKEFAQVPGVVCIPISGLCKKNIGSLFVHSIALYEKWDKRITTGKLNSFLSKAVENYAPPLVNGKQIKLKFMTQTNTKPPSFAIISNRGQELPESYSRYLLNRLRESFDLFGIPLRLFVRTRKNPFVKSNKK